MRIKTWIRTAAAVMVLALAVAAIPGRTITVAGADLKKTISPIEEIVRVAKAKGINPNDLLAISAQESSLGKYKSGDNGCSKGWFHINLCANPDATEVVGNPGQEAEWVSDRLISYGYLEGNITLAFARYNSPAVPNYEYAELVKKRLGQLEIFLKPYQPESR